MRRDRWNTYRITCYSYQAGTDQRATGGIHRHEVKRTPSGWMRRVVDANGRWESAGECEPIDAHEGEALYEMALAY